MKDMQLITPGVFRFLLAMIVVIHHNVSFLLIGQTAVYVFFVLSGYWIVKMYEEKYKYFQNSYKVFIFSRIFRLLPLYYLIFIISLLLSIYYQGLLLKPEIKEPFIVFSNLFLIGLSNAKYAVLLPGWSLDIELQFYLLAPLIIYLLTKVNKSLFLVVSIILSLTYFILVGENFYWLLSYFSFFVIGIYIYIWDFKASERISYFLLLFALIIAILYHDGIFFHKLSSLNISYKDFLMCHLETFKITLALLVIPYVTVNIRMSIKSSYDKIFSSMSYVIYLLHWPAIKIYSSYVGLMSPTEKGISFIIYILASIIFSYLITITFDNYFENLRKKYLNKQKVIIDSNCYK